MKMFHTQYDAAELGNAHKVYDSHDNVDRVSYVDNTTMVKRLILEGRSLAESRAAALRSGSYLGSDLKDIDSDQNGMAIPVYGMDRVIADPMIDAATKNLETSRLSAAAAQRSGAEAAAKSEVTGSSPAAE